MLNARNMVALLVLVMLTVLGLAPDPAPAQVAVSTLVPVSPNITGTPDTLSAGFVTPNPAAMQWGAPSRFGLGYGEGEVEPDAGDQTDFNTKFGGGRLVGMRFSASAEGVSVRDGEGPLDFAADVTTAALGVRLFSPLVAGALYSTAKNRDGLVESDVTSWSVGGSYRFGEWLFVGGSYGEDSLKVTDSTDPLETVEFDDKRPVLMYGAGIRVGGKFRVHLEVYGVDRDAYEFEGSQFGDSETTAGVAEVGWGPIVAGVRVISVNANTFGLDSKTQTQIYDVAWAPLLGLALGVHVERSELELDQSGAKTDTRLTALTLAYQF